MVFGQGFDSPRLHQKSQGASIRVPLGFFVAARESTPRNCRFAAISQVLRCSFVGQMLSRRKTGVLIPAIEPCEVCAQAVCGDMLYRSRKTSAMFSRFCGAKQRLSKPLRGNSTDFAAGECPRFPSPPPNAKSTLYGCSFYLSDILYVTTAATVLTLFKVSPHTVNGGVGFKHRARFAVFDTVFDNFGSQGVNKYSRKSE